MKQNVSEGIVVLIFIMVVLLVVANFSPGLALWHAISGSFFGFICGNMAIARGRSFAGGILGGFFFGLFSIFYYLIAGDTTESRVRKEEDARRKYREELKHKKDDV